uniref:CRAL-TRIO domain-containing protein n=1 Tax=Kalanchoe fedtschenkoi TaxID=63787 RepID=A0A7N1A2C7_KALFE
MSTDLKQSSIDNHDCSLTADEQLHRIGEVRNLLGDVPDKLSTFCSDGTISRYLRARNWNIKKAAAMLKDSMKWRLEYKPEEIRWEDVAHEGETGKVYRSKYFDKYGRPVLVMRPSRQNSKSAKGQIKHLVYCMENAIMNLPQDQEQMAWLIDFDGYNLSHVSMNLTRKTAIVLQGHYPERLGVAILYNPPKFFEPFFMMVKPFLEPKTYRKVKFVYPNDLNSKSIMEELFDMEQVESAFGGNDEEGFEISKYAERMRQDDLKIPLFWTRYDLGSSVPQLALVTPIAQKSDSDSEPSKMHPAQNSPSHKEDSERLVNEIQNGLK